MLQLLFLFMAYSVIGWLWETPYVSFKEKKFINRGFLRGPYIPIYGSSCLAVILSMSVMPNFAVASSVGAIILQMIYIALITAVFEYLTSYVLERIFNARWWDYSYKKYNLNGRIALSSTIFFGIGGYFLWHFVNPVLVNLFNSLNSNLVLVIVVAFYMAFILDNVFTLIKLNKFEKLAKALQKIQDKLSDKYQELLDKAREHRGMFRKYPTFTSKKFKEQIADMKKSFKKKKKK